MISVAHCFVGDRRGGRDKGVDVRRIQESILTAGLLIRDPPDAHKESRDIVKAIVHKYWGGRDKMTNDVALLQVRPTEKICLSLPLKSVLDIRIVFIGSRRQKMSPYL